jgi:hypothetical protein
MLLARLRRVVRQTAEAVSSRSRQRILSSSGSVRAAR